MNEEKTLYLSLYLYHDYGILGYYSCKKGLLHGSVYIFKRVGNEAIDY